MSKTANELALSMIQSMRTDAQEALLYLRGQGWVLSRQREWKRNGVLLLSKEGREADKPAHAAYDSIAAMNVLSAHIPNASSQTLMAITAALKVGQKLERYAEQKRRSSIGRPKSKAAHFAAIASAVAHFKKEHPELNREPRAKELYGNKDAYYKGPFTGKVRGFENSYTEFRKQNSRK